MPQPQERNQRQRSSRGTPGDRVALVGGTALAVPGAIHGHRTVQSARNIAQTKAHPFQSTDILKLPKGAKGAHAAKWLGARTAGGVGLTLASGGLYGMGTRRSNKSVGDLKPSEVAHTLHERARTPKGKSKRTHAAATGTGGLIGGGLASAGINRAIGKVPAHAVPHYGRAVGSTAGVMAGMAAGLGGLHAHQQRQERFKKRREPDPVRSKLHRNALKVQAAGAVPFVGDIAAASTAARLAPKEHRHRAAATVFGSNQAASLGGTAAGSLGAYHLAQRSKKVTNVTDALDAKIKTGKEKAREALRIPKSTRKPGKVLSTLGKIPTHLKMNTPAGAIGSLVGGAVASNTVAPAMYRHYQRKHEAPVLRARLTKQGVSDRPGLTKHENRLFRDVAARNPDLNKLSKIYDEAAIDYGFEEPRKRKRRKRRIEKFQQVKPLTNRDVESIRRGRRRQAKLSYGLAGMGAGATGLLLAGKGRAALATRAAKKAGTYVKPVHTPGQRTVQHAQNIAIASGGVGALSSLNFARTQKLEARQKVAKYYFGNPEEDHFYELNRRVGSREPGEWSSSRKDMRAAMKGWEKTHPHLHKAGQEALDETRHHRPWRTYQTKKPRRGNAAYEWAGQTAEELQQSRTADELRERRKKTRVTKADTIWRDKRLRSLSDPAYSEPGGIQRVHRTYPPYSWMKEHGVGVGRKGDVYVGHKQMKSPVVPAKAKRAGEHGERASAERRRKRAMAVVPPVAGVGATALSGAYSRGLPQKLGGPIWSKKVAIPLALATGASTGLIAHEATREKRYKAARQEGRSRYHGQNALIQAAGFNKGLFSLPKPRTVPKGVLKTQTPHKSYTAMRRSPTTGATKVYSVRGGFR